ncbi:DNA primase family protein [Bradyrhizobium sp. WSM1253]|uniref:DNA primase family protein n=1 Tax=Bradyrhizobium sp. WSM1253 TaxID=319003 RepID=UPI00025D25D8|nr:DNA primase family protein [Bradyrhizobium sp. WSM1253]EIG62294.1 putative ATPase [Bradyrhizobium sp. WSM1253]
MSLTDTSAPACAQASGTDLKANGTVDFLKAPLAHTTGNAYVCSFTNERELGAERHVIGRNFAQVQGFMEEWDIPGRGMFVCVSTQKEGTQKRNKENCKETNAAHCDIDFKGVDLLGNEDARGFVLKQIARLKYQPSAIIFSGNGVHLYYFFKESIDTQENMARIEALYGQLADVVAGDPAVCEVARVMRLPGTHNTKNGENTPVEIIELHPDRRYDLEELEEWLSEQSPIMLRKVREHALPAGAGDEFAFFEEYGKRFNLKPPIDVQQRLEGMIFMGGGENSIHQTQLQCSAALLNQGVPKDEVVATILAYTHRAAGDYGKRWNWRIEERNIVKMCDDWIKKHPPEKKKVERERVGLKAVTNNGNNIEIEQQATGTDAGASNVIKMPVITPAPPKGAELHIAVGKAVIAHFESEGEELINNDDGSWFYTGGVWELRTGTKWLDVRIEHNFEQLGYKTGTKLVNETRNWILRRPELWREGELPWDQHGKIPTRSGLVDPRTGALEKARPDHYCTWRVEVEYDPAAKCPWWETMIADMFGDRKPKEQAALVGVVQELLGAALIDKKARGLRKACVFWGNENRAKSGVLDLVAGLFGNKPITAGIGTVDGTHGLMPFTRRAPWVLHEAFTGQWHMSQTVKAVVTGDPVQINIKNGPMMQRIVRAPIFWATNFQPQFKEATRAIVDRMIVIEVTRKFDVTKPVGVAAEAIRRGFDKPGEFIIATELQGVLSWAVAGLRRALERGSIASTESIAETAKAIHQDSNLVAGFLEDCVEFDPMARIKVTDFCLAHSAWWMELKGEDRRLPTNEAIGKALRAMGDARVCTDRGDMRDATGRYYGGIALNRAGLQFHKRAFESRLFEGKVGNATDPQREVNSLMPASWDTRKSVTEMREHHADRVTNDQNGDVDEVPGQ